MKGVTDTCTIHTVLYIHVSFNIFILFCSLMQMQNICFCFLIIILVIFGDYNFKTKYINIKYFLKKITIYITADSHYCKTISEKRVSDFRRRFIKSLSWH